MRRIALLVVVLSCSRPSQPAQSHPTPPPNAQPAPVVKLPEQPIQKAAPTATGASTALYDTARPEPW